MKEQTLTIKEFREYVARGYVKKVADAVSKKLAKIGRGNKKIAYKKAMQILNRCLMSGGHCGRAHFGPTNSRTDINLIA